MTGPHFLRYYIFGMSVLPFTSRGSHDKVRSYGCAPRGMLPGMPLHSEWVERQQRSVILRQSASERAALLCVSCINRHSFRVSNRNTRLTVARHIMADKSTIDRGRYRSQISFRIFRRVRFLTVLLHTRTFIGEYAINTMQHLLHFIQQ